MATTVRVTTGTNTLSFPVHTCRADSHDDHSGKLDDPETEYAPDADDENVQIHARSEQTVTEEDVIARCEELYPGKLAKLSESHQGQLLQHVYRREMHNGRDYDDAEEEDGDEADAEDDLGQEQEQEQARAREGDGADGQTKHLEHEPAEHESDGQVEHDVIEDMHRLESSFPKFRQQFRLIKRIGEGTFSTVYKAEDLLYGKFDNSWDIYGPEPRDSSADRPRRHFVAIKKIYVTSSPARVHNELELLHALRGQPSICPLITAFRHTDQVIAVLPYFRHADFRDYFRKMTVPDIRVYLRSLFTALAAVHDQHILHRDIKPTNFLYDPQSRRGVLVDFGLAERDGIDAKPCLCTESRDTRKNRWFNSVTYNNGGMSNGYPRVDTRPSRRANRAGTRGFRAPEVLFKCTEQSTKIDIWSAGVILLTILTRRFPFFNSADDTDALIEMGTIFGVKRMRQAGMLHGCVLETTIPTITNNGYSLDRIVLWSTSRDQTDGDLSLDEKSAIAFMSRCLELDPSKRISAQQALEHHFLQIPDEEEEEDAEEDAEEDDADGEPDEPADDDEMELVR